MNHFNLTVLSEDRSVMYASRFWSDQCADWSCIVSDSAAGATGQYSEAGPDLAVVDLELGGRPDGRAAAELLDQLGAALVIVSPGADQETLDWAVRLHPWSLLIKPVGRAQFIAALTLARLRLEAGRDNPESSFNHLIPTCSHCKSVRSKQGVWMPVEDYLSRAHGVRVTHSLCPTCFGKLYPELTNSLINS